MLNVRLVMIPLVLMLLLAACGDDDSGEVVVDDATSPPVAQATATSPPDDIDDDETAVPSQPAATATTAPVEPTPTIGSAVTVPSGDAGAMVYPAGDAGEVELSVEGRQVRLVEIRPNDGWDYRDVDSDDDEIEIDFLQQGREIDFDAELTSTGVRVEVCDTRIDPQDGVHTVAGAGEVEFRFIGHDEVELIAVRPNDGWTYDIREQDHHEIEIVFRGSGEPVTFEIDEDDDRWEVKTCTRTVH